MKINTRKVLICLFVLFLGVIPLFILNGDQGSDHEDEVNNIRQRQPDKNYSPDYLIDRNKGVGLPDISAESIYSVYFEDGQEQILFSRNRNKKLPIASITKLMTALVVYENYDLSESIGIPDSSFFTNSHLADLRVFTDTTFEELLYPLLLESNNSGAYAAATAPDDVDFDDFIEMMNLTASDLGMKRTTYHNPSGLDTVRDINLSTARDVSILVEHLLEIPLFWDIMEKRYYDISSHKSDLHYRVTTTNRFLDGTYFNSQPDWYGNIIGGKTGFTYQAMGCLVMVLKQGDGYIVNVILGADGRMERFEEMEKLINWTYKAYEI